MSGSNISGPYNPLSGPGATVVLYGMSPMDESPRIPVIEPWAPEPVIPPLVIPRVAAPPAYAADSELSAINVLAALTPEERARVLRFAVSKWGPVAT